jgi:RNA polymerase sigma factor (sigma-70 family)
MFRHDTYVSLVCTRRSTGGVVIDQLEMARGLPSMGGIQTTEDGGTAGVTHPVHGSPRSERSFGRRDYRRRSRVDPADPIAAAADRSAVAELVTAAAAGNSGAWEALVERYSGLVWSIARAHRLSAADAADVSQVVWLRLVEHLDRIYRPGSVGTWLASVTRNECLRVIRRSGREVPTETNVDFEWHSTGDDVDINLLAGERDAALLRACDRLPPQWRSLMRVLMTEPRPSYEEIAAALDIPMGSIGPTRQRCLDRLRASPELRAVSEQW